MNLIVEAIEHLEVRRRKDEHIGKAFYEPEIASNLFLSVISGELSSILAIRYIQQGAEENRVTIAIFIKAKPQNLV